MPQGIRRERQISRAGFTLIELLVVIGIIAILVGILLPVVAAVRKKSQVADTTSMMTTIAEACHHYFQDYHAYPGPLPDSLIYGSNAPPGAASGPSAAAGLSGTGPTGHTTLTYVSSSNNAVLGLCGGITPPGSSTTFTYNYGNLQSPTGPPSLNPLNPRQSITYFDPKPSDLSNDGAGNALSWTAIPLSAGGGNDSSSPTGMIIPEFMDRFSTQHPIIYLRAVTGGTSICDTPRSTTTPGSQYFTAEMNPYWRVYPNYQSRANGTLPSATSISTPDSNSNILYANPTAFFQNPAIQDGVTPRGKDSYIMISAGPDGIYGTSDDILYPPN